MALNLWNFLRRAPPAALRMYFEGKTIAFSTPIDWTQSTLPRALSDAISSLGAREQNAIIADLDEIEQLCDPIGQMALHSLVVLDARLLSQLHFAECHEARAITALLEHKTLFDQAVATAYTDRMLNGRSWSAFSVPNAEAIRTDAKSIETLQAEISEAFSRLNGSGRKVKVDTFERQVLNGDGRAAGSSFHYCIHVEDAPETFLEFQDNDQPTRQTRRLVRNAAIMFDPEGCELDVISQGGSAIRNRLAESFARNILGVKGIQPIVARRFILNGLKSPQEFKFDAEDGIRSVNLFLLRLASIGISSTRVTIDIDPSNRRSIHTVSDKAFGGANLLHQFEWQVIQAKLRIVFYPEPGSTRDKNVTIDLRTPNKSNIREQNRYHHMVSQKYLAQWGLVVLGEG